MTTSLEMPRLLDVIMLEVFLGILAISMIEEGPMRSAVALHT